jgi:hypothetical protein
MYKREQSRAEWEREIRENITPAQVQRTAHYIAKRGYTAPIHDLTHFVELLSAGVLLTLGISAFSSSIPHSSEIAVAALAAGCFLGWTGFRWNR